MLKNKKMFVALAIPFVVIIMFLVKMFHTVESSKIPFDRKGGQVFTQDQFMQDFSAPAPIDKAIYAVVKVRKEFAIVDFMNKRAEETLNKKNKKYSWLGLAVKDKETNPKFWIVTFREANVAPKYICQSKVLIKTGQVDKMDCYSTRNKDKLIAIPLVQRKL